MSEKSQKTSRAMRDSNIELFRIITMIMIVAHHYVVNSGLMDIVEAQKSLGIQDNIFINILEVKVKTGIN